MAKKKDDSEQEYYLTPPTTQVDLEERYAAEEAKAEGKEDEVDPGRDYAVEDNDTSAYVGVDSSYMTYADETSMPLRAEEGAEAEAEKRATEGLMKNSVLVATSGSNVKDAAVEPGTYEDDARRTREGADKEERATVREQKTAAKEESTTKSTPAPA